MPKTLPAALSTAMDSGVFDPYLKVQLITDDPNNPVKADVLDFKLTDVTAECTIPYSAVYLGKSAFAIERGVMLSGEPVTIRSVFYVITSMLAGPKGIKLTGQVLPPDYLSIDGCIWYTDIIDQIFGANGWTWDQDVTYEDPAAAWLSYLFYPMGRSLTLANMQHIFHILKQKYLIFCGDNGDGLFVFQATTARAKDYDIADELLIHETQTTPRRLMWRDEAMGVHYDGSIQDPVHNLGYIDSIQGAAPANLPSPKPFKSSKLPVHLKYRTGDVAKLGTASNYFEGRIQVTEVFDPKSNPSWHVIIEPLCWYTNTEAGALPGTIEQAAPYTPLHTGYFNGVLSAADNNLQAAMETLDDHKHASAGSQVDHVKLGNIGSNSHAAIDTFIASKAQVNGLASLDANGNVPAGQNYHAMLDWPLTPSLASDEHFFALPAWTGWINDPVGVGGHKTVANHVGDFQANDDLSTSVCYRTITNTSLKSALVVGMPAYMSEGGIHLDDGTLNNYVRLGLKYKTSLVVINKRVCVAGVETETEIMTGLAMGIYGLRLYTGGSNVVGYWFKEIYSLTSLGNLCTNFFTPARLGFYFSKTAASSTRNVLITRWADNFS